MNPYGKPITNPPRSPARTQNPIIPTPAIRPPTVAPNVVQAPAQIPIVIPGLWINPIVIPQIIPVPGPRFGRVQLPHPTINQMGEYVPRPDLNRKREQYIAKEFKFASNQHFNKFFDNNILTDIKVVIGDNIMHAHKFMLVSASEYFEKIILGGFSPIGDTIRLQGISPTIFKLYLDLIYGTGIILNDWRVMFELFKYIDYTQTYWPTKDTDVINCVSVPEDDFIDYIAAIVELYHGEVPNDVIHASAIHLLKVIDLSPLGPDFLQVFLESRLLDNLFGQHVRKVDLEEAIRIHK